MDEAVKNKTHISFLVTIVSVGKLIVSCMPQQATTVENIPHPPITIQTEQTTVVAPTNTPKPSKVREVKASPTVEPKSPSNIVKPEPSPQSGIYLKTSGTAVELKISDIPSTLPNYDRNDWKHWIDEDRDCQNSRHEVLIQESLKEVTFKNDKNCQVASGHWHDPYTDDIITDATKLDVDHMVPLKNAHDSGGWAWDKKKKSEYANYMQFHNHLIAVTASANRQKGASGPDEWKPSNKEHWCDYAMDWIKIKVQWGLSATTSELSALQDMTGTCDDPLSITPVTSQTKVPSSKPTTSPIPQVSPKVSKSGADPKIEISAFDCKGKPETIVLKNADDNPHDMTGWEIVDEGVKHTFGFPNGFTLDSGMSVKIVSGTLGNDTGSILYWKKQLVWNNTGDAATLLDSAGSIIQTMNCP